MVFGPVCGPYDPLLVNQKSTYCVSLMNVFLITMMRGKNGILIVGKRLSTINLKYLERIYFILADLK